MTYAIFLSLSWANPSIEQVQKENLTLRAAIEDYQKSNEALEEAVEALQSQNKELRLSIREFETATRSFEDTLKAKEELIILHKSRADAAEKWAERSEELRRKEINSPDLGKAERLIWAGAVVITTGYALIQKQGG